MTIFPDIQNLLPDQVVFETDRGKIELPGSERVVYNDITLTVNGGRVCVSAEGTGLRFITLEYGYDMPEDSRFLGDAWERGYGELEWRGFVFDRVMPWYFFALSGETLGGFGVRTNPGAMCSFSCDRRGVKLHIDLRCGGDPVELASRELTLCEIVSAEYKAGDPTELFLHQRDFLRLLVRKAVFPSENVYGFNNWYYAYGNSSREEILANCAHLEKLTAGNKVRPYMVIDDGWQVCHGDGFDGGPWNAGNSDYGDMPSLAAEMAAHNVQPGIWIRPLLDRNPDLKPEMFRAVKPGAEQPLDPTAPGVLEYVAGTVDLICDWGFKLIKYDFTSYDVAGRWGFEMGRGFCTDGIHFRDRSRTTAEIITALYKTIHEAAAGRAIILGCNCVGHLGAGYMEINRTGDDTSGRDYARTRRMGYNTLAFRMPQHNVFYAVDADCAGLTADIPWEQNLVWLKMLAGSGTPTFVSVAPDLLNDAQNAVLADLLKTASEIKTAAVPQDVLVTTTPERYIVIS